MIKESFYAKLDSCLNRCAERKGKPKYNAIKCKTDVRICDHNRKRFAACTNIGKVTLSYLKEIRRRRDTTRGGREGDMQIRAEELPRGRLKRGRNDLLHLAQRR